MTLLLVLNRVRKSDLGSIVPFDSDKVAGQFVRLDGWV